MEHKEDKSIDRRSFLKGAAVGSIGAGLVMASPFHALGVTAGKDSTSVAKADTKKLEYRTLGRTGLKVTAVGVGIMNMRDPAVLQKALDLGLNYVDTARSYSGGENEKMVGTVMATRRKEAVLATKVHQRDRVVQSVEESLQALQTDYIDVIQLHGLGERSQVMDERAMEALSKLKKDGKVRFFGVTTHKNIVEVVEAAIQTGFYDTVLAVFNFKNPELKEVLSKAAAAGMGVIAMKTQQGGYQHPSMGDLSPHQASLRWVLDHPFVATAIPGVTTIEQVVENAKVMGTRSSWNDRKILDRYSKAIDDIFCRMCSQCEGQCPYGVAVQDIMRFRMYAEGYGDLELGREHYQALRSPETAWACLNCAQCVVRCAHGLNVAERMVGAHRLLA